MTKRFFALLLALLMTFLLSCAAFAHDVPDFDRRGSISIHMTYNEKPVPGGSLTIYRVAKVDSYNGDYFFSYIDEFKECEIPVTDLYSSELPGELKDIAVNKKVSGITQKIDKDGFVKFEDLELGLYLVVQTKRAEGFYGAAPFLVSVPQNIDGVYVYDADASPKTSLIPETEPPDIPEKDDELPDTGLNNWPVPVLAGAGLAVFCTGCILKISAGKKNNES
ncbi:MAG: hypothetical protein IJA92_05255 [Oscillospiraceae bacterium]|nr:hypothetical protein [Oscillospiraceae bacterium]